jgi:predicted SPOUT superfamily RNA methylase MTH1
VSTLFPPKKRFHKLTVAIPASLVSDIHHLREKTQRIGQIGRLLAIFRVDEVLIYPDFSYKELQRDIILIRDILSYMDTPQYLRRRLYGLIPEFRYVGILPPLRTPHHPIENRLEAMTINETRIGIVIQSIGSSSLVDIGVEVPVKVGEALPLGEKVNVKLLDKVNTPLAASVKKEEIEIYWGYSVTASATPIGELMKKTSADLVIATSKYGVPIMNVMKDIKYAWVRSNSVVVIFGSPNEGIREILSRENLKVDDVAQFLVNSIPEQGTQTVRTEEALASTLSILNLVE